MRRTAKTTLAAIVATCAALTLWAGGAQAAITRPYVGSFGPAGPGAGAFGRIQGVAVEQSTQDVYVYTYNGEGEGGRIYKFNALGEPVDFSGLGSDVIENVVAGGGDEELAIDESSDPAKGDIYVANDYEVLVYSATGARLGALSNGEGACGVAVDAAGHVYVSSGSTVKQYAPTANPVTNADYVSSLSGLGGCNLAVDGEGGVYEVGYNGGISKFPASQFNTKGEPAVSIPPGVAFNELGRTVAVDRARSLVFADERDAIAEYDGEGEPSQRSRWGSFGAHKLGESVGVAVNETTGGAESGEVYASSGAGRVYIYGPPVTIADVGAEAATAIGDGSATANGTVDPLGLTVTNCSFEYWIEQESEAASAACSPDPGSGGSPVGVSATLDSLFANSTYHYRLVVTDADGTSYGEAVTFQTLPAAPIVAAGPAISNVTRTSALVAPTIDDENSPSTVLVQFAAEGAYVPGAVEPYAAGASSQVYELSAERGSQAMRPLSLTGLLPGTTYHYRVVAKDVAGTVYSPDYTFTTAAPTPPMVETSPASAVGTTTAVLAGVVYTRGLQTSYEFEVGTDTSYSGAKIFGNAGQSVAPEAVSTALQFLVPGTTYHYRLVATSVDGTTYGPDMTFTTPQISTPISQPPAAPLVATPAFQFPDTAGAITSPVVKAKKTKAKRTKRHKHTTSRHKRAKSKKRGARAGQKRKGGSGH